jgi:hypothetical protein
MNIVWFAHIQDIEPKPPGFIESLWEGIKWLAWEPSSEVWFAILVLLLFIAALVAFVHWSVPKNQFETWQRHVHRHHHRRYRRHH